MFSIPQYPQYVTYILNGKKIHPKSKFTQAEDEKLKHLVKEIGEKDWESISKKMKTRNPRQCKERWFNYLSPKINFQPWTNEEDKRLEKLYNEFGPKWVKITQFFPARTDVNVKNRWLVIQRQKKKLEKRALKKKNLIEENDYVIKEEPISLPMNDGQIEQSNKVSYIIKNDLISNQFDSVDDMNSFDIFGEQFNFEPIMCDQSCEYYMYQ